jgi:hypothetical protein
MNRVTDRMAIQEKHEESILQKGIQQLTSKSKSYQFLENEDDLYPVSDIKEKYSNDNFR